MGEYWIVVTRIATDPIAYILTREEVLIRTHKAEKNGKASYWIEPSLYEIDQFRNAWPKAQVAAGAA